MTFKVPLWCHFVKKYDKGNPVKTLFGTILTLRELSKGITINNAIITVDGKFSQKIFKNAKNFIQKMRSKLKF